METLKAVIDTDLLIDLLRNEKQATRFIAYLEGKNAVLATTSVNIFELYHGAHKSGACKKNVEAIKVLTDRLTVLSLTSRAAQKAGYLYAQLECQGQLIGLRDTLIAAIALTREFSVATRNQTHFSLISGLKIITP